jgi:hypothetical protein
MAVVFKEIDADDREKRSIGAYIDGSYYGRETIGKIIEQKSFDSDTIEDDLVDQFDGKLLFGVKVDDSEVDPADFKNKTIH